MRGKYMSREKFFSALHNGFAFCDVVLGWDSNDQLYHSPGVKYTGWHTGYPDAPVRVIPESCRALPDEGDMLLFLCEFAGDAGALCPRNLLGRVLERAMKLGFDAYAAFEYEFFLFNETPDSIRAKGYRDLQPITPGFFGYSMLRNSTHAELYQELLTLAQHMDFPIEGLHTETGPGVLEAAIAVDAAGAAAAPPVAAPSGEAWSRAIRPDPVLLFRYSAATFNGHRIHYDHPYATGVEGYPGLVVHGPLVATLLVDLLRRNRAGVELESFAFRALRPLFDTAPFTTCGLPDERSRSARLWTRDAEGAITMEATAAWR